jgi:hypothetical protein
MLRLGGTRVRAAESVASLGDSDGEEARCVQARLIASATFTEEKK